MIATRFIALFILVTVFGGEQMARVKLFEELFSDKACGVTATDLYFAVDC